MPETGRFLVRARGPFAFRDALVERALAGSPLDARRRVVLVPTRGAGELLRQTIEQRALAAGRESWLLPDLLTRDDWMARLHDLLPDAPPRLSRTEREVLFERAAVETGRRPRLGGSPFHIRPGLVAAMLDFYDELRRRQRTVRRFVGALFDELRVERGTDRGSESLIHQTCFLGLTFLAYERLVAASGAIDEHGLRSRLIARRDAAPFDHVIVAVADRPADPRGLWPADFDLLGRLPGVARLDVVMTDETHDAGFRERLERELPGIVEVRHEAEADAPVMVRPAGADERVLAFVSRDREEELRDVARMIRARARDTGRFDPVAIVFQRPLPYLHLARQVLDDARVPYQTFDALPLASEPYAALLDLVLALARTAGTREAASALLRSPLLAFDVDGTPLEPLSVSTLDAVLIERRAAGDARSYEEDVRLHFGDREGRGRLTRAHAARAARAARLAASELDEFRDGAAASAQVGAIAAFLRRHERPVQADDPLRERHLRARAAVLGALDGLASAYGRYNDTRRSPDALTAAIHHAVERQTFSPRRGHEGVHLVEAVAARFGAFAHVHLVGLVETDWPERPRRSVFYGSSLLAGMGWPQDADQSRDQQAAFRDLLGLASVSTSLHGFQMEGDALVAGSPMIELARGLPSVARDAPAKSLTFLDEILTAVPDADVAIDDEPRAWLALRRQRPGLDDSRYSGTVPARAPDVYRVSRVDRFVDCPFKYFAETVLALPEEREDSAGLTPLERGTLVHDLFERFYRTWQAEGRGAISPATLPEAVARFAALAREALVRLPEPDRALEETRLLGSIVGRGLAERVFELESDAGGRIVERLIEHTLEGAFRFPLLGGLRQRDIEIRGKADRIDVFEDGSVRVIDYKLGRLPDTETSVQIGVYAHAARQALEARDGRPHPVAAAMYLAFGDDRRLEGRLGDRDVPAAIAVDARAGDFAAAVERIEAGEFPPQPRHPNECAWCAVAGVCRKEYRTESDEAAEPV
jgi:RecB family exonuclease